MRSITIWFCVALAITMMPSAVSAAELRFSDQTAAAGLDFVHDPAIDNRAGPMCAGGAVGDFNGDGFADLFLVGGGDAADALFINNTDGTFTDRSGEWLRGARHRGVAATVADYDSDGDDDVYVTSFGAIAGPDGPGAHRLLRNDGIQMNDVAAIAGVSTTSEPNPDGYGAAFGDYDRDGDLDLFVGGWHGFVSLGARLFRNDGASFVNVTAEAGIISGDTHAFGAVWADMDGDRYPELIVAGDFGTTRYYRNNRDGTFDELDPGTGLVVAPVPMNWSIGKAHNGMGITVGDFNRDGLPDWFLTAIWPAFYYTSPHWGNGLYINQGGHIFTEQSAAAGVADGGWGWGTSAVDLDNDGRVDLPMTNGWRDQDLVTGEVFTDEPTYLFRNRGDGSFDEVHASAALAHSGQGRVLLHLDYDRDGDMDIVILANDEPLQLFRNDLIVDVVPTDAHWLQLRLDTTANPALAPHGVGALVTVQSGKLAQTQQVVTGGTYLGQSELVLHFGLGAYTRVDNLTVDWGNGKQTRLHDVAADQRLTLYAPCKPPATALRPRTRPATGCATQATPRRNAISVGLPGPVRTRR